MEILGRPSYVSRLARIVDAEKSRTVLAFWKNIWLRTNNADFGQAFRRFIRRIGWVQTAGVPLLEIWQQIRVRNVFWDRFLRSMLKKLEDHANASGDRPQVDLPKISCFLHTQVGT